MLKKTIKVSNKQPSIKFDKIHYMSNQGMQTNLWGPPLWHCIHVISYNYPVTPTNTEKNRYRNFILNLYQVLPCGVCRANLKKNLKILPLQMVHMKNRETFSRYIYDLHELVNTMLHKKSNLTYEQVTERYEHFRSRCNRTKNKTKKSTSSLPKKENGCTEPLVVGSKKLKCVLYIVPREKKCESLIHQT